MCRVLNNIKPIIPNGYVYVVLDRGYASRVIRGREIILLGVKKTIAAMVDDQTRVVKDLETKINEACVSK